MAKQCAICGKGSMMVWRRVQLRATKYNPTIKRRQYPNLQWTKLPSGLRLAKAGYGHAKAGKRVLACAKCIKATAKQK